MLRRLLGYASIMFGASTVFGLLSFGANVAGMVSRSKASYGDYLLYVSVYSSLQGYFILGVNATIQRFAARTAEARLCFVAMALRLFGGLLLVCLPVAVGVGLWARGSLGLSIAALPWLVVWWWGRYLVRSTLDGRREATLAGTTSIATTGLQLLLLAATGSEHALVHGDFLAQVLGGSLALLMLRRMAPAPLREVLAVRLTPGERREAWAFARTLWLAGQVACLGGAATTFLIRGELGVEALATSGAASTLWAFAARPMELFGQATLPGLIGAGERSGELYRRIVRLSLCVFPALALVVCGGVPLLISLIDAGARALGAGSGFSDKYADAPPLLLVLACAVPVASLLTASGQLAAAAGESRACLLAPVLGVAANLAVLYPLTAALGVAGTILASHVATTVAALHYLLALRRRFPGAVAESVRLTALASLVLVAALAVLWSVRPFAHPVLAANMALAVFGVGARLAGLVRAGDLVAARRVLAPAREPAA